MNKAATRYNQRKYIMFAGDFILWNLAYYLTFAVIYDRFRISDFNSLFYLGAAIINICFTVIFICSNMYNKIWRYADIGDFFWEWVACIAANAAFYLITLVTGIDFGLRIPVMMLLISTFLLFMFRFFYRVVLLRRKRSRLKRPGDKRLLIVGAGEGAEVLLRELSNNPYNEYMPVCIADDDPEKLGRSMYGIKVMGAINDIPDLCKKHKIDCIILAILAISNAKRKDILDICHSTKIELKVIPRIYNSMSSDTEVMPIIRNVEVEDLLGRDQIVLDTGKCQGYIKDQTVLVTGGGGSIGSELCRQIAELRPKNLIILDIYENNAYDIQQELRRTFKDNRDVNFEVQIASIRDKEKMETIFKNNYIDVVFHAAAHKHVPLMENNPEEAIKNNVFGTQNLLILADKYKVKRFVMISTDKAVNPTNVMGCTKRICEMMVQQMNKKSHTEFVAVRFGNVLGSNGSVIPLFKKQIEQGGPVTVTDPEITRFFMTIPEAVSLVLTAGAMAKGGEIFVLDMGEPVKIYDLAVNLIQLSGFEPGKQIGIEYTGLRKGEKLYEELLMDEEGMEKTPSDKIWIGKPIDVDEKELEQGIAQLKDMKLEDNKDGIDVVLKRLVPTFNHNKGE